MEEVQEKVCHFCLSNEGDFVQIETSAIEKFKIIVPELVSSFPDNAFMCRKCGDVLENSFELRNIFLNNIEVVQQAKENSPSEPVDLNTVVKDDGSTSSNSEVCRICLSRTTDCTVIEEENNEFKEILTYCLPELDLNLTLKPMICDSCHTLLSEMYNLKKECLAADEKNQTLDGASGEDVKTKVETKMEEENDFLSGFEVQDEEGDIFDSNAVGNKREATDPPEGETYECKKQRLMAEEIVDEELPSFHFDSNLLYNPNKTDFMVEDWLEKVEEYRKKFEWSDFTTIHKVLVHLKGMNELYIWFNNIADIMDWEQWKKKLVRAFPGRSDYSITVKKMMIRKKRREETYVSYYNDKLKLMEPLNLNSEQKISCIFGGITDILVCCIGRVGDYKEPEDLLDYFKSCDDKQAIEAAANINKDLRASFNSDKSRKSSGNAPPSQNSGAARQKGKRTKCFDCRRFGHTVAECRQYKIGEHLDKVDAMKKDANPKPSQALARRPPRKKTGAKCTWCGKVGHSPNVCRLRTGNKGGVQGRPAPPPRGPGPKPVGVEKCSGCQKTGHTIANCFKQKPKNPNKNRPRGAGPKQQQARNGGGNDVWTRCRDCGKYGSRADPCCAAKIAPGGTYIGSYSAAQAADFNKQICLRCYKTGHPTKDCEEFARKMYRK